MRAWTLLTIGFLLLSSAAPADEFPAGRLDNWHQWRGPLANGTAPRGDPPVEWGDDKNIRWKAGLPGQGSSTPIVWGDRLFVMAAEDTGRKADPADIPKQDPMFRKIPRPPETYHRFLVLCFDRKTGKELWRQVANEAVPHEGHHDTHTYAAGSPTTDGERLYVSFGSFGTYCYDLDGKLLWKKFFGRLETRRGWGEAVTPVVHRGSLIINWDHEGPSHLYVLDAKTGEVKWKKERDEVSSWATPLVVEHGGKTQVVINATGRARGYDLATGEVLWECGGQTVNAIPSPVAADGKVVVMSGYTGSACFAIPLDARGDLTGTDKVAWKYDQGTPYVPSPVLTDGRLYFGYLNLATLTCLDFETGKPIIERVRLPISSQMYASPVAAAGRLYFVGRNGTTAVLQAGDEVKVLATNRLDDTIDASPVVVGRQLFLRGHKYLYCIEEE